MKLKLHRHAKKNPVYLLLAAAIGTDEYGHIKRFKTDPYDGCEWAIGSGEDFICGDYHIQPLESLFPLDSKDADEFSSMMVVVTHYVRNSETGHYIEDAGYDVDIVDVGDIDTIRRFCGSVADAWFCHAFEEVRHSRKGWNQDHLYFYRSIFRSLVEYHLAVNKGGHYTKKQIERYIKQLRSGSLQFGSKVPALLKRLMKGGKC